MRVRGQLIDLRSPKIMGIVNLTPDSFYDGGKHNVPLLALKQAEKLLSEGADILDLGAFSTRPGAADVSSEEEINRLRPVVKAILKEFPETVLSIDTFRSEVAEMTIDEGAAMINDISGGTLDRYMFDTIARLQVPYILMHTRGTPQTMQSLTDYKVNIADELVLDLGKKIARLREKGVRDIILDPGFGFAKTMDQNYALLAELEKFRALGLPILGAISRKSMIYKKLGITAAAALNGTTILNTVLFMKGVNMIRVHDVKEAKQIVDLLYPDIM